MNGIYWTSLKAINLVMISWIYIENLISMGWSSEREREHSAFCYTINNVRNTQIAVPNGIKWKTVYRREIYV